MRCCYFAALVLTYFRLSMTFVTFFRHETVVKTVNCSSVKVERYLGFPIFGLFFSVYFCFRKISENNILRLMFIIKEYQTHFLFEILHMRLMLRVQEKAKELDIL